MGVRERRARERHEMRRAILDAAREIAAQEGWHAVTIRRVAEKIEYSPPTIYEYFESKEAILAAESSEGFRLLLEDLRAARDAHDDPRDRLFAMGAAYWDWVWRCPELYQVISGLGGVNFCEPTPEHPHTEGQEVSDTFRDVLRGILPDRSPDGLDGKICVLWSLFHGFIALLMAGRIPGEARGKARGLALGAVADLIRAWQLPAA